MTKIVYIYIYNYIKCVCVRVCVRAVYQVRKFLRNGDGNWQ